MTELLYLHDSYLKEFDATVTSVSGQMVTLDRTAFSQAVEDSLLTQGD